MSTFRNGLLLATLFLSACSMPILQDLNTEKVEQHPTRNTSADDSAKVHADALNTTAETKSTIPSDANVTRKVSDMAHDQTLLAQFNTQKQLANQAFIELKHRTGSAEKVPSFPPAETLAENTLNNAIDQLTKYTNNTNQTLAALNKQASERQNIIMNGDLIQVFLSKATVSHGTTKFEAQPLVGQWLRGESRVIRLKDNILFENPLSENMTITFSEKYQLVVNGEIISTVNPNREKNSASFDVSTPNNQGRIVGKIEYRIVANN